jgi:hypothetical protein
MRLTKARKTMVRAAPPDPPVLPEAPDECEERDYENCSKHDADGEADQLLAEPGAECLIEKAVLALTEITLIEGEGKGEYGDSNDELQPVKCGLESANGCDPLSEIAHAGGPAEVQQQPHNKDGRKEIPQKEPVATLEVGIGAGAPCGRHLGEIRVDGDVDVQWLG